MGKDLLDIPRTRSSTGSVSRGRSRIVALYPIVILRVADVGKVTNRQLIVLEMILISQQSIKASSRRLRCNAWLPRNRVRTRKRRWTSQLNGGLCKIIFCGAGDGLVVHSMACSHNRHGDVMNSSFSAALSPLSRRNQWPHPMARDAGTSRSFAVACRWTWLDCRGQRGVRGFTVQSG